MMNTADMMPLCRAGITTLYHSTNHCPLKDDDNCWDDLVADGICRQFPQQLLRQSRQGEQSCPCSQTLPKLCNKLDPSGLRTFDCALDTLWTWRGIMVSLFEERSRGWLRTHA